MKLQPQLENESPSDVRKLYSIVHAWDTLISHYESRTIIPKEIMKPGSFPTQVKEMVSSKRI